MGLEPHRSAPPPNVSQNWLRRARSVQLRRLWRRREALWVSVFYGFSFLHISLWRHTGCEIRSSPCISNLQGSSWECVAICGWPSVWRLRSIYYRETQGRPMCHLGQWPAVPQPTPNANGPFLLGSFNDSALVSQSTYCLCNQNPINNSRHVSPLKKSLHWKVS